MHHSSKWWILSVSVLGWLQKIVASNGIPSPWDSNTSYAQTGEISSLNVSVSDWCMYEVCPVHSQRPYLCVLTPSDFSLWKTMTVLYFPFIFFYLYRDKEKMCYCICMHAHLYTITYGDRIQKETLKEAYYLTGQINRISKCI